METGYTCARLHCQNGGHCESLGGNIRCMCPAGFAGQHCEVAQMCHSRPCRNGATCVGDSSAMLGYRCLCPGRFAGYHCDQDAAAPEPVSACPYPQCEQQAGDRVCDPQCNNHMCQWDGGDCSLHWERPWSNCTASVPCWELFRNKRCDKECDNSGCLFDSFECQESPQCK